MNLSLTLLDWIVCISTLGGSVVLGLVVAARLRASESPTASGKQSWVQLLKAFVYLKGLLISRQCCFVI
jgi:cytochrome bd-type quinol oxidase subunit 2